MGPRAPRGPDTSTYMALTARQRNRKMRSKNRYFRIARMTAGMILLRLHKNQLRGADGYPVPIREASFLDDAPVDQSSVSRFQINDPPAVFTTDNLGVLSRDH